MLSKNKLIVLKELRDRLNGECCSELSACPYFISNRLIDGDIWTCDDCVEMFEDIVDLRLKCYEYTGDLRGFDYNPCPCTYAEEIAITRLDEYIEELGG